MSTKRTDAATRRARTVELLADGKRPAEIAAQLDVSTRSIRRYVGGQRDIVSTEATEQLAQLQVAALSSAGHAMTVLDDVMRDEKTAAATRVAAAKVIVENSLKLYELTRVSQRVDELAERVGARV